MQFVILVVVSTDVYELDRCVSEDPELFRVVSTHHLRYVESVRKLILASLGWDILYAHQDLDLQVENNRLPSNLSCKLHEIDEFKCFSSRLAVVFAQSTEAGS